MEQIGGRGLKTGEGRLRGGDSYGHRINRGLRIALISLVSSMLAMLPVAVDKAALGNFRTERAILLLIMISSVLCLTILVTYYLIRWAKRANYIERKRESALTRQSELFENLKEAYIVQDEAYERDLDQRSTPREIRLDVYEGRSARNQ